MHALTQDLDPHHHALNTLLPFVHMHSNSCNGSPRTPRTGSAEGEGEEGKGGEGDATYRAAVEGRLVGFHLVTRVCGFWLPCVYVLWLKVCRVN